MPSTAETGAHLVLGRVFLLSKPWVIDFQVDAWQRRVKHIALEM